MNYRQTIDQHRNIITIVILGSIFFSNSRTRFSRIACVCTNVRIRSDCPDAIDVNDSPIRIRKQTPIKNTAFASEYTPINCVKNRMTCGNIAQISKITPDRNQINEYFKLIRPFRINTSIIARYNSTPINKIIRNIVVIICLPPFFSCNPVNHNCQSYLYHIIY